MISKGKIKGPIKLMLYAPEGFGKSTFGSNAPDPVYIDTEGSTKMLDVARFDGNMTNWNEIMKSVDYVIANPDCCQTLVIDTVDWAENSCIALLNEKHNTENILTLDYGKGSLYVVAEFEKLIKKLDKVIESGINVILLAHAVMRKQELPDEMGAFDRWELKLQSKQVKAMIKEWVDVLLFGNYKTFLVEDSKTKSKKAQGGKRVMYASHRPTWDAKNRHGLPDELDFEWKAVDSLFYRRNTTQTQEEATPANDDVLEARRRDIEASNVPDELKKLMLKHNVIEWDIQMAVSSIKNSKYTTMDPISSYDPDFLQHVVIDKFDGMLKKIEQMKQQHEIEFLNKGGN